MTGGNSKKVNGTTRTLRGFSSAKLTGEKWYDIYVAYNRNDKLYANTFTTNACNGLGDFAPRKSPSIGMTSQIEGCKKGAAYLNVWMYVIHEMEAAISDCKNAVTPSTHWDEAVAFYTGSTTLLNPTTNIGFFQYSLAEKKCPLFKTCGASSDDATLYKSTANDKVFSLFGMGSSYQATGRCSDLVTVKESLVKQFTVPVIQGIMHYLFESEAGQATNKEKSRAELWSFASAVLPLVNSYNPSVAALLLLNANMTSVATVPSTRAVVKAALESVYGAIGITCADVGGYYNTATGAYYDGMSPCMDNGIAGYPTTSDVTQHLRLDLDLSSMFTSLALKTAPGLAAANATYCKGNVHIMPKRLQRILHGFNT